jgi:hypothetical protein
MGQSQNLAIQTTPLECRVWGYFHRAFPVEQSIEQAQTQIAWFENACPSRLNFVLAIAREYLPQRHVVYKSPDNFRELFSRGMNLRMELDRARFIFWLRCKRSMKNKDKSRLPVDIV